MYYINDKFVSLIVQHSRGIFIRLCVIAEGRNYMVCTRRKRRALSTKNVVTRGVAKQKKKNTSAGHRIIHGIGKATGNACRLTAKLSRKVYSDAMSATRLFSAAFAEAARAPLVPKSTLVNTEALPPAVVPVRPVVVPVQPAVPVQRAVPVDEVLVNRGPVQPVVRPVQRAFPVQHEVPVKLSQKEPLVVVNLGDHSSHGGGGCHKRGPPPPCTHPQNNGCHLSMPAEVLISVLSHSISIITQDMEIDRMNSVYLFIFFHVFWNYYLNGKPLLLKQFMMYFFMHTCVFLFTKKKK